MSSEVNLRVVLQDDLDRNRSLQLEPQPYARRQWDKVLVTLRQRDQLSSITVSLSELMDSIELLKQSMEIGR